MNEKPVFPAFNSFAISSFNTEIEEFRKKNQLIRYHYTSAGALKNILSNTPNLRFTDSRFMNDHTEMVYCVRALLDFLKQNPFEYPFFEEVVSELLLKKHTDQEYFNLSTTTVEFSEIKELPYEPVRCFLFCMSTDGDALPMWNYYTHSGKYEGYNIGFDVYSFLKSFDTSEKNTADPMVFYYGKVLYKEADQFRELKILADDIEKGKSSKERTMSYNMVKLRHFIESYGLFFKHEAFQAEKEFRIVLCVTDNLVHGSREKYFNKNLRNVTLDFYERNGVLVPFLAVPINKDAVKKITISPIIEQELAEQSVNEILQLYGYSASVETSRVPIRF